MKIIVISRYYVILTTIRSIVPLGHRSTVILHIYRQQVMTTGLFSHSYW